MSTTTVSHQNPKSSDVSYNKILLELRPNEDDLSKEFMLKLWVRVRRDGEEIINRKRLEDRQKDGRPTRLEIQPRDLRFLRRELPNPSKCTLFGQKAFEFNYNVRNKPDLRVTAIVKINCIDNHPDYSRTLYIKARLLSGFVAISELNSDPNGLKGSESFLREQVWPDSKEEITKLYLGSSKVQIEVEDESDKARRLEFVKNTRNGEGRLWKMLECPELPALENPEERINKLLEKLETEIKSHPIESITRDPFSKQDLAIFYHILKQKQKKDGTDQEVYIKSEVIRPDLKIKFADIDQDISEWIPKTLYIRNPFDSDEETVKTEYVFLDNDEIDLIDSEEELAVNLKNDDIDVEINWEQKEQEIQNRKTSTAQLETVPELYFAGLVQGETVETEKRPYIWQFGQIIQQPISDNIAIGWIRYRTGNASSSTRRINDNDERGGFKRIENLKNPFTVKVLSFMNPQDDERTKDINQEWKWTFDLPERKSINRSPLRVRLTLTRTDNTSDSSRAVKLELVRPTIVVKSPSVWVFKNPLKDPESVPYTKTLDKDKDLVERQFKFENEGESLEKYRGLKLCLNTESNDDNTLEFTSAKEGEVVVYPPAHEALIDLVPGTGANLVASEKNGRVSLPRDPNHGLAPIEIKHFQWEAPLGIVYSVEESNTLVIEGVIALLPWVQWEGTFSEDVSKYNLKLFHRNLVQEQAEFLSSVADRFDDVGEKSVLLPVDDFLKAVRGQFAEASSESLNEESSKLINWLPGAKLQYKNDEVETKLSYGYAADSSLNIPEESELRKDNLPIVRLEFQKQGTEIIDDLTQILSLNTKNEWLAYALKWTNQESISSSPIISIDKFNSTGKDEVDKTTAINSSVQLLFNNNFFYDNLGILRKTDNPGISNENPWLQEIISFPKKDDEYEKLLVLSYKSNRALVDTTDNDNETFSQIYFACEQLKLKKSDDNQYVIFDENLSSTGAKFYRGVYGFYSQRETEDVTNGWVEIYGIPIFVTRLEYIKFTDDISSQKPPQEIKFQAVLPNPTRIEKEQSDIPLFIKEAITKKAVIWVTIEKNSSSGYDIKKVDGDVNWSFSLNQQNSTTGVFPGKLAKIQGEVKKPEGKTFLQIKIDTNKISSDYENLAAAFGQLFPLAEGIILLKGKALGDKKSFEFSSDNLVTWALDETIQTPKLRLSSEKIENEINKRFTFYLNVNLGTQISDLYSLQGVISHKSETCNKDLKSSTCARIFLQLKSQKQKELITLDNELVQGRYFCLLGTKDINPIALILWVEKERDEVTERYQPELGGILLQESNQNMDGNPMTAKIQTDDPEDSSSLKLCGKLRKLQIISSLKTTTEKDSQGFDITRWNTIQEIYSGYLFNEDSSIQIHIGEQILRSTTLQNKNIEFIAYLRWKKFETQELQGPIKFIREIEDDNSDSLNSFIFVLKSKKPNVLYAQKVDLSLDKSSFNLIYSSGESFTLQEANRLQTQQDIDDFCELKFENSALKIKAIPQGKVPIDFCLEPEAVQDIDKLPIQIPQLSYRDFLGTRLRIAQLPIDFPLAEATNNFPPAPEAHEDKEYWLLRPIDDTTEKSGDRLIMLNENIMISDKSEEPKEFYQTENLLLLFRDVIQTEDKKKVPSLYSLASLLNVSTPEKEQNPLTVENIADRLEKTGSVGVAILRKQIIDLNEQTNNITYELINSPFYDQTQSLPEYKEQLSSQLRFLLKERENNKIFIDPIILLPSEIKNWSFTLKNRYQLSNAYILPPDPLKYPKPESPSEEEYQPRGSSYLSNTGDLPLRSVGYEQSVTTDKDALVDPNKFEHFQLIENPTYEESEPLWFLPNYQFNNDIEQPNNGDRSRGSFQPKTMAITYGIDKPGSMFIHKFQSITAIVKNDELQPLQIEPSVDFALREPQQFKTPPGAKIEIEDIKVTPVAQENDLFNKYFKLGRTELKWHDSLGEVYLSKLLKTRNDEGKFPIPSPQNNSLLENVLQIVVQFDQNFLEVNDLSQVIPILKSDQIPTRIYLVTRIENLQEEFNSAEDTNQKFKLQVVFKYFDQTSNSDKTDVFKLTDIFPEQSVSQFLVKDSALMEERQYYVWESTTDDKREWLDLLAEDIKNPTFQLVFQNENTENPQKLPIIQQKAIKEVQPLVLSPKMAAVVRFDNDQIQAPPQRTILFGDAASPDAKSSFKLEIQKREVEDKDYLDAFRFLIQDQETSTVSFTQNITLNPDGTPPSNTSFFIIKYLVGGQTLYSYQKID